MKLPSFKRETAAQLDAERMALAAADAALAKLSKDRLAALGGDDLEQARRLDDQIAAQQRTASLHRDRISVLVKRHADETEAARQAEYGAAVDRLAAALPARGRAVAKFTNAIAAVVAAYRELDEASQAVLADWPSSLPGKDEAAPVWHREMRAANRLLETAFRPLTFEWHWPIEAALRHVQSEIETFTQGADDAGLVAALRERGPAPLVAEENAA